MGIFDYFKKKDEPEAVAPAAPVEGLDEPQPGFMERLRGALRKTKDILNTDIRDLFKAEGRLVDEAFLDDLFAILVRTDMGVQAATEIRERVGSDYRARVVHMSDILATIKTTVVLVGGVNGSGKTTSIAKLAHRLRTIEQRSIVLGAGDTFRAGAVKQLAVWADRLGVEIVQGEPNSDPASVAHRAVAKTKELGADVCIVDTAGRLQTQTNLMQELEKIRRVITKQIPEAPHEVLLVLDATAGQNGLSQAQGFSDAAKCTGIVLAKFDGTAKGGVAIPIRQRFNLPVKFVGIGEKESDLEPFSVDAYVDALFD
jgi:fused signal recognition particle receptor